MRYKKVVIIIVSFILFLITLNLGLNIWIATQLPKIINKENDSAYSITYENLEVSLLNNTLHVDKAVVIPKNSLKKGKDKSGIYAQVKSIDVAGFSIWDLLFTDKIKARSLTVGEPEIILYKKNEKVINDARSVRSKVVKPFHSIIMVSDIYVYKGNIKIINIVNNKAILHGSNINVKLNGISIDENTMEGKIPFRYGSFAFNCDSLYFRANPLYHIRTKKIMSTDKRLNIQNFQLIPEYNRQEFIKKIAVEKDMFTINVKDLTVRNMDWGYQKEVFGFNSDAVVLSHVFANIYRNKIPTDDLTKKFLYNKLLRDLKFALKVDTLAIRNSILEYEEEKTFEKGAGKLEFTKFNLTAHNLRSGLAQPKLPDVKIKINCLFMGVSPLHVDWTLHMMDKNDGFNIKGRIRNFNTENIAPFAKPYMNLTAEGILNNMYFNLNGNDDFIKGQFAVKYEDLKVTLYKKGKPKEKNKFLSAIGNLFVKNDTKGEVKTAEVEVKRIPEKSFYNLLWSSIAEGLKKIMI